MFKNIDFFSRMNMLGLVGTKKEIVISITNPQMENAKICSGFKDVLFLKFDNISSLTGGGIRFSTKQAQEIIDFVKKYESDDSIESIYVNCMLGESRSAAVASYLSMMYNIKLDKPTDKKLSWICKVLESVNKTGNAKYF